MLAHHLVQLYWTGKIELGTDSPLVEFLDNANISALCSTIIYIGQSLAEAPETVSPEIVVRLENLWDYILESHHAKKSGEAFAYFGWWFNTSYFEDHWPSITSRVISSWRRASLSRC